MKILKERLGKISGGRVLDVGTRGGEFILKLKEGLKDYTEIIGIDNDEKVIEKAKNKFEDSADVHFMLMDAGKMTFADNSFDIVSISNTLHHLPAINKILEEMKRVLKPGGVFIINEMFSDNQNDAQLTHVELHHLEGVIDTLLGECHNQTFKKEEIIDIAKHIGLRNIDVFEDYETDEKLKDKLAAKVESLAKKIEKVKEYNQYEEIKQRADQVTQRFNAKGIERCTQLIVIGEL